MAKYWEEPINKHTNWDGDKSTQNLPVKGEFVQKFIRDTLESKAGFWYYDPDNNRYIVFADEENKDLYLADPTRLELIIATFDAPFNYSAQINLESPNYVAALASTKNIYVDYTFDTFNKNGASVGESVIAKYVFIKGGVKQTVTEKYRTGQQVHFKVDDYISAGTNTLQITITGENTLAATTVGITFVIIDLKLSDTYDITQVYNPIVDPNLKAGIPYSVEGYGTKVMEWYVDGVQIPYNRDEDEIVEISAGRVKYISLANLSQGKHSLQFRVYTMIDGEKFYSNILYRDLLIDVKTNTNPIIGVATEIPVGRDIVIGDQLTLYGITQYVPYTLRFAVYNPTGAAVTPTEIYLDNVLQANIDSKNGEEETYALRSSSYGDRLLKLVAGNTEYNITLKVDQTDITIDEITDGLVLSLQALGRSNSDANRDKWTYGSYETTFTGFNWNNLSGWYNNRLQINKGAYIDVNIAPLATDITANGYTMEFELMTKNVIDENAIICDCRNALGVGLLITASKAELISSGNKKVTTRFKYGETIRIGFVIERKTGTINQKMAFVYVNGVICGSTNYTAVENFISSTTLRIGNTQDCDIELKDIRFYSNALNMEQMLNNYMLYRDTVDEMFAIYDKNNIYEEGTSEFSIDALSGQLPVMLITGNIPELEGTTDKNKTIYVDLEYINLQDPSKSFTTKGTRMRPQGTSSMGYPKKNFRIYTNYGDMFDSAGKKIEGGKYSFKSFSQPVDCWCFKADYAESSSTHNTGVARLWNDVMKNLQLNGQYVCRTEAQNKAIENGYNFDVSTTIDGFPCVMFYRLTENDSPIFMGKYNFNNDKSTESVFGFEGIPGFDNSKMQCWEVLNNGNHLALFEDTENWNEEWEEAYEGRYPDGNTDTVDLKDVSEWIVSTRRKAPYSGNITINSEIKTDNDNQYGSTTKYTANGEYADSAEARLNKFIKEKWDYLDVYKVAAYYIYLMRFAAVDQVVKNAMFTTEGTHGTGTHCKWFFINYDNDTVNGLRNDGLLIYNWDIDRQTIDNSFTELVYAYAGHESTLWNNLEADPEFMRIVKDIDNALYMAGLSYNEVINMFDKEQSNKWCERVYNKDAQYKYIGPFANEGINNLFMLQGTRQAHRKWWLTRRFELFDSMYVSGEYKSRSIEFKVANTPIGLSFKVTAGANLYYGYGVNNVPIETNIKLDIDESHDFITKQVLNVGDPVRIYGATNIKELDISAFTQYLSTLNINEVFNDVIGSRLEKLILGIANKQNNSLTEISGLAKANKLKHLNIQAFRALTSLDLTNQQEFEELYAMNSTLTSLLLPSGAPIKYLQIPNTLTNLNLENLTNFNLSGLSYNYNNNALRDLIINNCPNFNSWTFVTNWKTNKATPDAQCSITINNINWHITTEQLINLGTIKQAGGTLNLKGKITIPTITEENYITIVSIYGENVFDKNNELFIAAPDLLFIEGYDSFVEGNEAKYTARVISSYEGITSYVLLNPSGSEVLQFTSGSAIIKIDSTTGLVTTTEGLSDNITFKVRVKYGYGVNLTIADKTVNLIKIIYPNNNTTITGEQNLNKIQDYEYQINLFPDNVNGDWSLIANIPTILQDYIEQKELTDKQKLVLTVKNLPTDIITGNINVIFKSKLEKTLFTKILSIALTIEGVIMTSASNPRILKILYDAGLCSSSDFMTEEEAAAVTSIIGSDGTSIFNNKRLDNNFNAFKYFINIPILPEQCFRGSSELVEITLPPQIINISNECFYTIRDFKKINLDNIIYIGNLAFSNTGIEEVNFKNVTTIETSAFVFCSKLKKVVFNKTVNLKSTVFKNANNLTKVEFIGDNNIIGESCFECENTNIGKITDINLDKVIDIGPRAFKNNLPDVDVVLIGVKLRELAFANSLIRSVNLNTTSSNDGAFQDCINLTTVTFNYQNLKIAIASNFFSNCNKLNTIINGDCIEYLYSHCFSNTAFENIDFQTMFPNVSDISTGVFKDCNKLKTVTNYPLTAIKYYLFLNCELLESFSSKENIVITTINDAAFKNCTSLISVNTLGLTVLGSNAFNNCINFEQDVDLTNVLEFYESSFIKCGGDRSVLTLGIETKFNIATASDEPDYLANLIIPDENQHISCVDGIVYSKISSPDNLTLIRYLPANPRTEYTLPVEVKFIANAKSAFIYAKNLVTLDLDNYNGLDNFYIDGMVNLITFKFKRSPVANSTNMAALKLTTLDTSDNFITINNTLNNLKTLKYINKPIATTTFISNGILYGTAVEELHLYTTCSYAMLQGLLKLKKLYVDKATAISDSDVNFGAGPTSYTGYENRATGENILYVPQGATGYDAGKWLDPLQNIDKCGFTISYTL